MNNLSNEHDDCDPISSPKNEQIEGGNIHKKSFEIKNRLETKHSLFCYK